MMCKDIGCEGSEVWLKKEKISIPKKLIADTEKNQSLQVLDYEKQIDAKKPKGQMGAIYVGGINYPQLNI